MNEPATKPRKRKLDAFSALPISKQARYQLRHKASGRCVKCSDAAVNGGVHCAWHERDNRKRSKRLYEAMGKRDE